MKLNEMLSIKYPIIQGGMANIATGEFAAAVSNAGGLGLIGAGGMHTADLKREIEICRQKTNKPFGVNIMLMNPDAPEMAELLCEEKISIVTTGAGSPLKYMEKWKKNHMLVMPVTSSVMIAKKMEAMGADAIIAEGMESGGHIGEMTTMALIPQMVEGVHIPVICAGGIASGAQLLAAFALGAAGAQIGTCLLASQECPIHPKYKEAVLKARDNQTIVTGRIAGTPVRILKNKMAREYVRREKEGADKMELEKYTLGSLRKAVFDGDTENGSLMAGQVCGQLHVIRPVAAILEDICTGADECLQKLEAEAGKTIC